MRTISLPLLNKTTLWNWRATSNSTSCTEHGNRLYQYYNNLIDLSISPTCPDNRALGNNSLLILLILTFPRVVLLVKLNLLYQKLFLIHTINLDDSKLLNDHLIIQYFFCIFLIVKDLPISLLYHCIF